MTEKELGEAFRLGRLFKDRLLKREAQAARQITDFYRAVRAKISADLLKLLKRIAAAEAAGVEITPNWLFQERRFRRLIEQVELELGRFSRKAAVVAEGDRASAIIGAVRDAERFIEHWEVSFEKLPVSAIDELVSRVAQGSPLRLLFQDMVGDLSENFARTLVADLAAGEGPRSTGYRLAKLMGNVDGALWKGQLIARTESIGAYRRVSQQRWLDAQLEEWMWLSTFSPRTCAQCLAMHGKVFPMTTPFASHPACYVAGHKVSGPRIHASSDRWYSGDVIEIVTLSGNLNTVTPNHPILTDKGWVSARLLKKGDKVISDAGIESLVGPDEYQEPAFIQDVARTLGSATAVTARTMPTASMDFHGDGMHSEVHIVRADSSLGSAFNASFGEPLLDPSLVVGDVSFAGLSGLSDLTALVERESSNGECLLCGESVSFVLSRRASAHHQTVSVRNRPDVDFGRYQEAPNNMPSDPERVGYGLFGLPAGVAGNDFGSRQLVNGPQHWLDASLTEHPVNYFVGDTVSSSELANRLASVVFADEIVKVRRYPFSGHVYNLETSEGWYVSNGIITHNCRCTAIPVVGGLPAFPSAEAWLRDQDEAVQRRILGKRGRELWSSGAIKLDAFVEDTFSPVYGPGRRQRSIADMERLGLIA